MVEYLFLSADAIGNVDAWATLVGSDKPTAVTPTSPVSPYTLSDVTNDDNTSYIQTTNADATQKIFFSIDPTFTERIATIESITVYARVMDPDMDNVVSNVLSVRVDATNIDSSVFNVNTSGAWLNVSKEFTTRPDGELWTEEDLRKTGSNQFEFGITKASQPKRLRCTTLYSVVAYEPSVLQIPQRQRIATQRLLRRRTEEQTYSLTVPLEHLNIELMDLANVSHDSLPLSASRLDSLEDDALVPVWKRFIVRCVGRSLNIQDGSMTLLFKDHESFMSTYWSSDRLPDGTNDDYSGLARMDLGGEADVVRSTKAYMEQENNVKLEISQNAEGLFYKDISVNREKMNHTGFLAEESNDNPLLNSVAKNGATSWSQTTNGGTIDVASTLRLAFPSNTTDRSWRFARTDDSNDTYHSQTIAVVTADSSRRIYLTVSEEDANTVMSWRLQRDTDSEYWNDSTPGWQVSSVWNNLNNNYDGTNSLSIISRQISNSVSIDTNENWTLDIGLEGASLPAGGGEGNIYSVGGLKGPFYYTEIPTDAATVTASTDVVNRTRTSLPQLVSATRGTMTCDVVAIQDGTDLSNGDEFCLVYWQYTSTDGDDFDALIYEKQSTENARFSYVRYISGTQDARAYYEVDIVPDTEYRIACVYTDDTNGELGEANSRMKIFVNGTEGTSVTASANHDDTEAHTEIWFGCAPSATGFMNGMNYTRNLRFWPRPFSDEEVPT